MTNPYGDIPLGQQTDYVDHYDAALLSPIPRSLAREVLALPAGALPFKGVDVWNAYELSWLDQQGKPVVAMAQITVPCDSDCLVESKSLKLYLNGFANTRFAGKQEVAGTMEADLSAAAGGPVTVRLQSLDDAAGEALQLPAGDCVDTLTVSIEGFDYAPALLGTMEGPTHTAQLYSHLVRSLCPVTRQPDWATVVVRYTGKPIAPESLLRYLVSFRNHSGFHEQVVELVYQDIQRQCAPQQLSVQGFFTRRGGLDINPFRSSDDAPAPILRTPRQ
ncbi:NADPH-dependent 7-cyano-7-deazaguanine reductase QueF [Alcanivorax sp. JB21]|uniref:NADPH-dependent 7-cyano-7-deazaguanine reductase QueF n=1 Tax=Alcanivorax limicola TaxID=2874102 RepID=UPI001CC13C30|nr:NADPH-dependent 7-cyano-7-deazaguanine reductase QueF [Alcanivorax limicola]MBZ2189978.1 NADPH-dependent 7-cyano-7-deazaguanine reductase QueF [Alcanivorax limicola]